MQASGGRRFHHRGHGEAGCAKGSAPFEAQDEPHSKEKRRAEKWLKNEVKVGEVAWKRGRCAALEQREGDEQREWDRRERPAGARSGGN